jgi:carbamoyltransferase
MAPYGTPRQVDKVWKLIEVAPDGSFRLNMEYFAFHRSTTTTYSRKFVSLFGSPRDPDAKFFTEASGYPSYFGERPGNFHELARENQHYADLAASIQAVLEEVLVTMARALRRETGQRNLCIAGGVGLNSVANWEILREAGFDDLYVHPAAGDAGGALGAALYAYHTLLGKPRAFVMEHASWGKAYDDGEVGRFLVESGIRSERLEESQLLDRVVEAITRGAVVGWHHGRFEWGPRALGHRSILADPRRAEMKDVVNTKIKFREPYRPFAPSVLAERAGEFFDAPGVERLYPARFMLVVPPVRESKREVIPAVTHADGTGRLQTVVREWSPRYHELIRRFGEATGVPVLLNTSFNLKGEPIVNTPAEAHSTFVRSGMDYLVLGNHLIKKDT